MFIRTNQENSTMTRSDLLMGILMGVVSLLLAVNISCAARQQVSPAGATAPAPSLPEMIEQTRGSVVGIIVLLDPPQLDRLNSNLPSGIPNCFKRDKCVVGTGFLVNNNGAVVTASHVADGLTSLMRKLDAANIAAKAALETDMPNSEGRGSYVARNHLIYPFRIEAEDQAHDIAILSATTPNLFEQARPFAALRPVVFDIARPRDGESVFACGYPLNADDIITTSGHLASAWEAEIPRHASDLGIAGTVDVYRLDLTATFGNSGGPVFLAKNQRVIGMLIETIGISGGGWTANAIPSRYITEMLDQNHVAWKSAE